MDTVMAMAMGMGIKKVAKIDWPFEVQTKRINS